MDAASASLETVKALQGALNVLSALQLVSYRFPQPRSIEDGATFDYVIVGGGTAGSVVASRLSEDPDCTVAIIEAGGGPVLESVLPGLFTLTTEVAYDYNIPTVNDGLTSQYLQDRISKMTAGKLLGGSSSLNHMMYVRGNRLDYKRWAEAAKNDSWNYDNLVPYFKKMERVVDSEILESDYADYFGTDGNIGLAREPNEVDVNIIKSFQELGYGYRADLSVNPNISLGITEALYNIDDGVRQSTAESYLGPAKDRSNLFLFELTTATKIVFDENKNAIGVEAITSDNKVVTIKAKKEVILSAGSMKTPQLLMLSGIGPKSELEKFSIPTISELPVGQTFEDHVTTVLAFKMGQSDEPAPPANPHIFPVPSTFGFKALDPMEHFPDCQSINALFPHDSPGFLQLCSNVFRYNNDICNQINGGNIGHDLFLSIIYLLNPFSSGSVQLNSADPLDDPLVTTNFFAESVDLDKFASCIQDISTLVNTTYFKNVESEIMFLDIKECESLEKSSGQYWSCYGKALSSTIWHTAGSAPMGAVLDSELKVRGVQKLRVVDAAAMPHITSGNPMAGVVVLAEKAADMIRNNVSRE